MGRRKKLQDNDRRYNFLLKLVNVAIRNSYRSLKYIGTERIPKDAAVIFAPNHQNALFDALALLSTTPAPVAYWVRGDLFKNKWVAKLFYALKLMPAYRKRNGLSNLKKNDDGLITLSSGIEHNDCRQY